MSTVCYGSGNNAPSKPNWLFIGLLLFVAAYFLFSCSPYNKLQKHPPLTTKDSTNLSKSCVAVFPPTKPTFVQGKPVIKIVHKTDTVSKNNFINKVDTIFKNTTNIDSLREAIKNEAAEDCNPFSDDTSYTIHDTLIVCNDSPELYQLHGIINILTTSNNKLQKDSDDFKAYKESIADNFFGIWIALIHKWWWWLILVALGVGVYLKRGSILDKFVNWIK